MPTFRPGASGCRGRTPALAADFQRVGGAQWQRRGRRGDGAAFTVDSFARYFIHDPVHHLWDVTATRAD